MNLTIDEAIMNIDEEMERLRDDIENAEIAGITVNYTGFNNHIDSKRQLVDWLKELKELREQIPCEDAVSRNAIIRALNTMDRYVSDELTLCNTDRKFPKNEVFIVDDVYEEIVERLPSVQPDPCGGEQ